MTTTRPRKILDSHRKRVRREYLMGGFKSDGSFKPMTLAMKRFHSQMVRNAVEKADAAKS